MIPPTILWSFLGVIFFLFLGAAIVLVLVWDKAEDSGKAKGRGEMAQATGELLAENKRLKGLLANVPVQYLIAGPSPRGPLQLGPGLEYTRTDKWKSLATPEGGK